MTRNEAQPSATHVLRKGGRVALAGLLALLLGASCRVSCEPEEAFAIDEETQLTALELEKRVEQTQAEYAIARAEVDAANEAIEAGERRIADIESQIPEQQKRSAVATRELYKFQQQSAGLVDFLLSADSFYGFLTGLEYIDRVADENMSEMNRLAEMRKELENTQSELRQAQSDAAAKVDKASAAMGDALEAQAEVQRRIEEEARHEAELAAAAAAQAAQPRDNDQGAVSNAPEAPNVAENAAEKGESTSKGEASASADSASANVADEGEASEEAEPPATDDEKEGSIESGTVSEEPTAVVATGDEPSFIAEWAPRIDAYLAGSPLAGQGATFAKAAYAYNVDPRWSPAISYTESSKGAVCFASHNAWGWGSSSWSSWEEAIDAHVGGLSRGYGYTISEEGAKKYCPPNWQHWYNTTLAQMNLI